MPFQIIQGSILNCRVDAVVNPTDEIFSGSGGLDAQIHRAAGPGLREACDAIGRLGIGQAVLTPACGLDCGAIIHTVAPWWSGREEELDQLRACYRSALRLAEENGLRELAFPLIGSGTRRFPKETVLEIAVREIRIFLNTHDDFNIRLVVHDRGEFRPSAALLEGLERFRRELARDEETFPATTLDLSMLPDSFSTTTYGMPMLSDEIVGPTFSIPMPPDDLNAPPPGFPMPVADFCALEDDIDESADGFGVSTAVKPDAAKEEREAPTPQAKREESVQERKRTRPSLFSRPAGATAPAPKGEARKKEKPWFARTPLVLDESFSQMVMRKIDECGYKKDSECYVRANIDRRLFSKIRSDRSYHPKKTTAVALAVALELPLEETRELLEKAGYTLSHSILFDVIVEYCISQKNYDIFEINELLFQYDQPLLGG
ncbi:MAG: macro domain-containing protein [Oscillospiraceae bacterium]|nr:macro domain-containing protein [Oscillospiraceae bacterium]